MQKLLMAICMVALTLVMGVSASFAAYTLTVASSNPSSGVAITVSPSDVNSRNNGTTQFTRSYNSGTVVTLTAPATSSGGTFLRWNKGSSTYATTATTSVSMTASTTMTAVYGTPARYTLTVASTNPTSGVAITVSPNDYSGLGNGTTQFTRSYYSGTAVRVTAPATASGKTFSKWQKNGADYATTAATSVTVSANTTMTAVYASAHAAIQSYDGPQTCIACHNSQAQQVLGSLHMQWKGATPNVTNSAGADLGKAVGGINTFCTYAMSSQSACFNCHLRLDGNAPDAPTVNDIDCLMCHNDTYQRKIVADPNNTVTVTNVLGETRTYTMGATDAGGNYSFVPDYAAMPAGTTMVTLAQTVQKPTRKSCLRCHAKAGGADWAKRGDMGLNTATPTLAQDVHMSADAGGGNLACSACHKTDATNSHLVGGRGIDLRQTEAPAPKCTNCHGTNPHGSTYTPTSRPSYSTIPDNYVRDRHGNEGVGCMTCHIDAYGKGAATEMSRNWLTPVWNAAFCNGQGGFVGEELKQSTVPPEYVLFDGTSYVYSIRDKATDFDGNGKIDMAKANGKLFDGKTKVVPIKRHLSVMPVNDATNEIIPPQISWMFMTGTFDDAVWRGMQDFGYYGPYTNKPVEAEMLIAHGVAPKSSAKTCTTCHNLSGVTPDTYGPVKFKKLGYHLWPAKVKSCTLCHSSQSMPWKDMHNKHAEELGKNCIGCHTKEPTGWKEPPTPSGLCNNCHSGRTYSSAQDLHKEHAESEHSTGRRTTCTDCHTF